MRAVILDLGETLIHAAGPWEPVMERACRALAEVLCAHGIQVDCEGFAAEFAGALRTYQAEREASLREPTTLLMLRDLLTHHGLSADEAKLRAALDAHYTITRANWRPAAGSLPTLRKLREGGLRLGLLSNAADDADVRVLARDFGFAPSLDFVVTSAQLGFRKPDKRAFLAALAHWDNPPGQVAMVGDSLKADIEGALSAGLRAIWITANPLALGPGSRQPDAVIRTLDQLPLALVGL